MSRQSSQLTTRMPPGAACYSNRQRPLPHPPASSRPQPSTPLQKMTSSSPGAKCVAMSVTDATTWRFGAENYALGIDFESDVCERRRTSARYCLVYQSQPTNSTLRKAALSAKYGKIVPSSIFAIRGLQSQRHAERQQRSRDLPAHRAPERARAHGVELRGRLCAARMIRRRCPSIPRKLSRRVPGSRRTNS